MKMIQMVAIDKRDVVLDYKNVHYGPRLSEVLNELHHHLDEWLREPLITKIHFLKWKDNEEREDNPAKKSDA